MTFIDLATLIGNVLTGIDSKLADPTFPMSDPNWQTLYALRKHLDDQQKRLIQATIVEDDQEYLNLTKQISTASAELKAVISEQAKINTVISDVSQIAAFVDQILKLIP
jgi:hypothetical protein